MAVYKDPVKKTWFCKFRYTDWQGKSHVTTKRGFKTQREAKAYEAEKLSKTSVDIVLGDVLDAYLRDRKPNIKHSSFSSLERAVRKFIRPQLGHIKICDLDAKILREWELWLQGYVSPLTNKPISNSYLHSVCSWLSSIFNYSVKYYGLPSNPMQIVGLLGCNEASQAFWTVEQYNAFKAVLPSSELKLCFDMLFYSGMRLGELLALTPADIDYSKGTVSVSKSVIFSTGRIEEPKTKYSVRIISMPATLLEQVREHVDKFYEAPERIFNINYQRIERAIKKYAKVAEVPTIRVHDLRHSHASLLIHEKTPITAISKRLGHASPATTLRIYSHMYNEAQTEIADLLDGFVVKT